MIDRATLLKFAVDEIFKFIRTLVGFGGPQSYRPEAHYMRGPGPKWRALHGEPGRAVASSTRSAGSRTL